MMLTSHVEGMSERVRRINYLTSVCKRMAEQQLGNIRKRQTLLSATNERRLPRSMIAHVLQGHGKRRNKGNIFDY